MLYLRITPPLRGYKLVCLNVKRSGTEQTVFSPALTACYGYAYSDRRINFLIRGRVTNNVKHMKTTVNITKFISSLKFINACPNLYIAANNAKLTIATITTIDTAMLSLYFNSLIVNLDSIFSGSYNALLSG